MDKINRALSGLDDNTARLEVLARRINSAVVKGTTDGGVTSFGTLGADGGAAIVAFDGGACDLVFCGKVVASGASPLFAKLSGSGELKLSASRTNARGIVFGAK